MRISDWSSDVCSSDLRNPRMAGGQHLPLHRLSQHRQGDRRCRPGHGRRQAGCGLNGGRIVYNFQYHRADSLADAAARIKAADDGKLLAGGMTLIPTLKQRLASPSDLVDLADVSELKGIRVEKNDLVIGAMTTHAAGARSRTEERRVGKEGVRTGK